MNYISKIQLVKLVTDHPPNPQKQQVPSFQEFNLQLKYLVIGGQYVTLWASLTGSAQPSHVLL